MKYRKLGGSGLDVSVVGLGTNNFGGRTDYPTTESVIGKTIDEGINFIDTADFYGGRGKSEEFIGQAVQALKARQKVLLATKVSGPMGEGPNMKGNSRHHIMNGVEGSLRRLQTDHIDLYQIHYADDATPIEETLRALDDLVRQGKVRYIGCSNFMAWQVAEAIWTSRDLNLNAFVSVQPQYNMLSREVERELLPFCQKYRVGVIPYSPLAGGFLTGKYRRGAQAPQGTRYAGNTQMQQRMFTDRNFGLIERLNTFATEHGHTLAELAIAWLLGHPDVSTVISGATKPGQVTENAKAAAWELSTAEMMSINALLDPRD